MPGGTAHLSWVNIAPGTAPRVHRDPSERRLTVYLDLPKVAVSSSISSRERAPTCAQSGTRVNGYTKHPELMAEERLTR
jgi:hypothetical protein